MEKMRTICTSFGMGFATSEEGFQKMEMFVAGAEAMMKMMGMMNERNENEDPDYFEDLFQDSLYEMIEDRKDIPFAEYMLEA